MQLEIEIEETTQVLSIGKGFNDWVWLAHYASRAYSRNIYPQGVYIPTLLYISSEGQKFYPHPREKIKTYLECNNIKPESVKVFVKIRKGNHNYTEFEKSK